MENQIQQVQRVTLAGAVMPVTFTKNSGQFLVKNFSSGDIYASFEETVNPSTSIKISSGMGQRCVINENGGGNGQAKAKVIYLNGTGEVEVQILWF